MQIQTLKNFDKWFKKLDKTIKTKIFDKFDEILENDNFGDCENLKDGVFELRFHFGAGYRIYFGKHNQKIILLLCGGDKSTQQNDIKKAKELWQQIKNKI